MPYPLSVSAPAYIHASRAASDPHPDVLDRASGPQTPAPRCTRSAAAEAATAALDAIQPITMELIAERASKMFSTDATAPTASGMGLAVASPTNLLVHLIFNLCSAWPQAYVDARSHAYGNFDRVVAMAWLVSDALALPLPAGRQALALGGAVRKRATKIDKDLDKVKRAASRQASAKSVYASDG